MHAVTLNISLIWLNCLQKGLQFTLQNKYLAFWVPPPNCGPKELKSFNINRKHIYHSSIVNYRVWYLCASGKPHGMTGYRISGLGFKERRKPLEKRWAPFRRLMNPDAEICQGLA